MPSWSRLLVFGVTPVFFLACGDSNPVATPQVVMRIEVRAASSLTVIGGAFPVTATVFAQDGSLIVDRAVEWGTSNAAVAVVTSTGNLTARVDGKGIGPVTISAKLDGKSGFMPLTGTGPVPPAPPTLTPIAFLWSETEGFTTIPPLPGATVSIPAAINGAGTVVGAAYGTDQQGRLFIWSRARGTPIGLGLLPGSRNCFAWGINDAEVVVGTCYFQAGPPRAFRWSAAGGMREIPVPPGAVGNNAKSINSAGDVAGSILVASGSAVVSKPGRWNSAGVFEELKLPLPITSGEATGIDDAGNAVGWASQGGYYDPTGFLLWKRGSATETVIEMCTQSDCAT
ncbi:MAG TPA: hypothetical protein VNJ04_01725, partial [Gemmatimonadaceae bacterium]|nr:hypothetical protein [Gemmatimonadaceae bacterium]